MMLKCRQYRFYILEGETLSALAIFLREVSERRFLFFSTLAIKLWETPALFASSAWVIPALVRR